MEQKLLVVSCESFTLSHTLAKLNIIRSRTASEITCTTSSVSSTSASGEVVVRIDDEVVTEEGINYTYRNNPNFTSVSPQFIIPAYVYYVHAPDFSGMFVSSIYTYLQQHCDMSIYTHL